MDRHNAVSVSWGDHLVFGQGVGRLATPEDLARRMEGWRDELAGSTIHWRENSSYERGGTLRVGRGHRTRIPNDNRVTWDELAVACKLSRAAGFSMWLYVTPFDEGWPLAPRRQREISHHNPWHGKDVAWQSQFSQEHPEFTEVDRTGATRQWGILSLAYPEVRDHQRERFVRLAGGHDIEGLFVCLRSQSRPAEFADQFGFNEPVRDEFRRRFGQDILHEDFDVQAWRDLRGSDLTTFLAELKTDLSSRGLRLGVGCARGDVLGPPFGNATLDWRTWAREGIVDRLVIDQDSSHCPSLWIRLWPMHSGYGYLVNYLDGRGLPPLEDHVREVYAPVIAGTVTELFVARQWRERAPAEEERLLGIPGVAGLVFGSFRFDNPEAVRRGDWRA